MFHLYRHTFSERTYPSHRHFIPFTQTFRTFQTNISHRSHEHFTQTIHTFHTNSSHLYAAYTNHLTDHLVMNMCSSGYCVIRLLSLQIAGANETSSSCWISRAASTRRTRRSSASYVKRSTVCRSSSDALASAC